MHVTADSAVHSMAPRRLEHRPIIEITEILDCALDPIFQRRKRPRTSAALIESLVVPTVDSEQHCVRRTCLPESRRSQRTVELMAVNYHHAPASPGPMD